MPDIIRLLPDSIANQIAAGEVVQRPASVVKELLENSLDAGATQITLLVRDAGRSLIQVTDDGKGMSETDARMCFERHATSKIRSAEDLWAIRTMGFRGEAMAAISAVARVELRTRPHGEELGSEIVIEGSVLKSSGPAACPEGSTICVKDLFFNTPARRNFLKSNNAELRHIIDEFNRCALARPEVAFTLIRGEDELLRLPKGKLAHRIAHIFGRQYGESLVPVQEAAGPFSVKGYMGKPEIARKTRGEQFFFVNDRYIRHPFLHHAVASAFEGLLPADFHPFYTVFIETDPARFDINVSPTKTEAKFDDERTLYAILFAAVRKALAAFHVVPPMDFEGNINFGMYAAPGPAGQGEGDPSRTPHPTDKPDWGPIQVPGSMSRGGGMAGNQASHLNSFEAQRPALGSLAVGQGGNLFPMEEAEQRASAGLPQGQAVLQFGGYLATPVRSGLMLVEIQGAQERIFYERYVHRGEREAVSQQCIFPIEVELSAQDAVVLDEIWQEVAALGFTLRWLDARRVVIDGTPVEARAGREQDLLLGLLAQYIQQRDQLKLPRPESLARALATRTARLQAGRSLEAIEMQEIIARLFACQVPSLAPDGRPITVLLGDETVGSWFGGRS